jgi:hypothetical protein
MLSTSTPADIISELKLFIKELWPNRNNWFNKAMIKTAIHHIRTQERTFHIKAKHTDQHGFQVVQKYATERLKNELVEVYSRSNIPVEIEEIYIDHRTI